MKWNWNKKLCLNVKQHVKKPVKYCSKQKVILKHKFPSHIISGNNQLGYASKWKFIQLLLLVYVSVASWFWWFQIMLSLRWFMLYTSRYSTVSFFGQQITFPGTETAICYVRIAVIIDTSFHLFFPPVSRKSTHPTRCQENNDTSYNNMYPDVFVGMSPGYLFFI